MYLYQVVPQTYGVPKKWNWLCKKSIGRANFGRSGTYGITYDIDEIGDLEYDRENEVIPSYDYDTSLED